jgi:methionine synthase II (cobalamin-independent)
MTKAVPDKVHLVGSVALDTVEEVFRTAGTLLGRRLKRVPDGESGGRRHWIFWQYPLLCASPYLRTDTTTINQAQMIPKLRLGEGVRAEEIHFGELGYAREARASYQDFVAARARSELPQAVRFQVSLPTPMAVTVRYCVPHDIPAIEPAYENAMLDEVAQICRAIPHRDLAIQWDVCIEMVIWDGQLDQFPKEGIGHTDIIARLKRLADAVPLDVELGFHLCYGDYDAKHFVEPIDGTKMVELANAIASSVRHPIAFLHMPVPVARSDDAFFRPFANLKLAPTTELYLGLVHAEDGAEGIKKRAAAATKYISTFGIAMECGISRRKTPDIVRKILALHAEGSREPPE